MGTGYKFALGSAFGACAILWSLLLESMIHNEYARSGERINVVWQAPSYILIGAGEIFSISTAYEVAFIASPPNKKAFACAFNLFCIGGTVTRKRNLFRLFCIGSSHSHVISSCRYAKYGVIVTISNVPALVSEQ
jgi:dipeptide/tripeptide permease